MRRTIKVSAAVKEYFKVMGIIKAYANNCIRSVENDNRIEIEFSCSIWKLRRCSHELNLAMALGIDIMIES
ncbi:MAG: hypothetical protein Q4G33_07735 [bacterium]|nr:hypothetical protein [bacterium]